METGIGAVLMRRRGLALAAALSVVALYVARRRMRARLRCGQRVVASPGTRGCAERGRRGSSKNVGVNAQFLAQLRRLVPIVVPGVASREAALLTSLAAILVMRTWLDIWFSSFNGVVVRAIVTRDAELFFRNAVVRFGLMMWPMSVVNNSLKLNINLLALAFRSRLARYAHGEYLRALTFYKVANIDNRVHNADQLLTQDIDKFAETLTHLYSDIAKPLVDIGLFAYKLGQSIGADAPVLMLAYFAASGAVLRMVSPPFGRYTAQEQHLEGKLRHTHARVIAHSEEIAFYRGAERERGIVDATFGRIIAHMRRVYALRFANGIVDSVLVKYCATQLAYYILSRPAFGRMSARSVRGLAPPPSVAAEAQRGAVSGPADDARIATRIMEDYSRNSGFLINLSQAVGRLVLAGRDLTRFAGYTHRVSGFLDVLADINAGRYQRAMVASEPGGMAEVRAIDETTLGGRVVWAEGVIEFEDVPVCTPNGDVLVPRVSLRLEAGMHCLITGPNGCGKSSLFRILGGLWPLFGGTLTKPSPRNMFYVPQKPYLPLGTLRDQLIYPHTAEEARARGYDDAHLAELLNHVALDYLVERVAASKGEADDGGYEVARDAVSIGLNKVLGSERSVRAAEEGEARAGSESALLGGEQPSERGGAADPQEGVREGAGRCAAEDAAAGAARDLDGAEKNGWDMVCDWTDVLSGGEKQRVAMARLFYHRPQFAILDECTSAVSLDVEGAMYRHAQALGITLFTISHRPSLVQYHQHLLKFDGDGGYEFGPLSPGASAFQFAADGAAGSHGGEDAKAACQDKAARQDKAVSVRRGDSVRGTPSDIFHDSVSSPADD